jgi:hypothetical protein
MNRIKKGEGFNQGKTELLAFLNLVKAAEEVFAKRKLWVKLELQNFSDNAKTFLPGLCPSLLPRLTVQPIRIYRNGQNKKIIRSSKTQVLTL